MRLVSGILCVWVVCQFRFGPAGKTVDTIPAKGASAMPTAPMENPVVEVAPASQAASGHFYSDVDYLLFWFKPVCLNVPIITVGSAADAHPGTIGQPGTQVVVGGTPPHHFDFGATSGIWPAWAG